MAERIERAPVGYPFSFVVAGDSGAWPDPTADGIFGRLVSQIAALEPAGLCSHFRGVCTEGPGRPEDRGSLYHAVEITISDAGAIWTRLIQAIG